MARHSHPKTAPARLASGLYGNGGRATGNGRGSDPTDATSRSARRERRYALANRDGAGLERHKGHKFSQADYETLKLGW